MTGFLAQGFNPLSAISVRSLEDMGTRSALPPRIHLRSAPQFEWRVSDEAGS